MTPSQSPSPRSSTERSTTGVTLVGGVAAVAVLAGVAIAMVRGHHAPPATTAASASASAPEPVLPAMTADQLDGRAFPDHVLALTWDDGPDVGTKALATFLADEDIAATFFVVESWVQGVSSDPGSGKGVFETGYSHIPILADLVKLRHRIGNHTRHHALLTECDAPVVAREVRENQDRIDPFLTNELRLFRAPGGAWSEEAAKAVAEGASLRLTGPIRWDIDRKDWENSVGCRAEHASEDCELVPGGQSRVKPSVTAERYLESIDEAKHGIVLFHDRVGDVGSDYAIRVARMVIPMLEERGYVFAAPVLAFGPLRTRAVTSTPVVGFADEDGDGRADLWRRSASDSSDVVVQPSLEGTGGATDHRPFTTFGSPQSPRGKAAPSRPTAGPAIAAALGADADGALAGDLNGDGRPDACGRTPAGFACAFGTKTGYTTPTVWTKEAFPTSHAWLADINGDRRADLCVARDGAVACGLAP